MGSTNYLIVVIILLLTACGEQSDQNYSLKFSDTPPMTETEYIFGIHPLHNPQRLFEVFSPMMEYLSNNIDGASFKLEASRNYAAYNKKLYAHKFHFSLPNPFQTINAVDGGYEVFGKMGDDENFRGIIIVRKDSGITSIADLKNKAVSYPAPTALAATMMPQYYMQTHGLDVLTDIDNRYVGSQESSIMNVFLKQTSAGSTWPPAWRALSKERPELAEQLTVKWETEPLLNNGLVVLASVPAKIKSQVTRLLTTLHEHPQGQTILKPMGLSRFEKANNETYQPIRNFIKIFAKEVRPIE
jgi:phosphonate transport system substrate-binding protein